MGWLDKLRGEAPASGSRAHVAALARPFVNQPALDANSKRIGMWVITPRGVDILTGCRIDGLPEVTLAKPDGTTLMTLDANDQAVPDVLVCDMGAVHRADINDIPESRRGDIDRLRAMGYTNGGA